MPRGVALTAGLLLLILAGIAMAVGLFRPRELDPARELVAFTGGESGARPANLGAIRLPDPSHHPRRLQGQWAGRAAARPFRHSHVRLVVPNTPGNLVAWLMDPPAVDPLTAMPATGLSQAEARDIAAYLYTLR